MDITEFFELSAGKWFSQRTLHNLVSGQLQAGKSELKIDLLAAGDPSVIKLCEQHNLSATSSSLVRVRTTWNIVADLHQKNGSTVFVLIPNTDNPQEGKLLQENKLSRYVLNRDNVLILISESDGIYAEERLWYLMPNLRIRTRTVKQGDVMTQASFCSEIRMGVTQAPNQTASTAASSS